MGEAAGQGATTREFTQQSENFEKPGSLFRDRSILDWIAESVEVPAGAQILDVAGGTGLAGRHLTRGEASLVVLDMTEAMLAEGLRAVREEGRRDVTFVHGDATELPFPDGQFDVVLSRFALHHMDDPAAAVREMQRVTRTGGSLRLIDMVSGGHRHDVLERLRDPSHVRALGEPELLRLLGSGGETTPAILGERRHTMGVEAWLRQSKTPEAAAAEVRAAFEAEATGGEPTGLHASRDGSGGLTIAQHWVIAGT